MYRTILVPVDLSHTDKLNKALATAADLSRQYGASLHLVSVTAGTPGAAAHTPHEFEEKLRAFAAAQSARLGTSFAALTVTSPDPAVSLDQEIDKAARQIGADLIVMASHVPGFAEHIFASNAGYLASHSALSVFVVRG